MYRPMTEQACYLERHDWRDPAELAELDAEMERAELELDARLAELDSTTSAGCSTTSTPAGSSRPRTRPLEPPSSTSTRSPSGPSSTAMLDDGAQLDLMGGERPLAPGPRVQPPLFDGRAFDRPSPSGPPSRYHSPAWQGTVEQASLDPSSRPPTWADVADQAERRRVADAASHNRPPDAPVGPHDCPGPATCPHRWLTDQELAALDDQEV